MTDAGPAVAFLHRQRRRLEEIAAAHGLLHTLSLARYRLHEHLLTLIARHAEGTCLDAGSGRSPYKTALERAGGSVTSTDVEDRAGHLNLVADIQDMPQIASASIDTILCTQVLEHLPRPWDALEEVSRVLRPGGAAILSVPHLSIIHEAPHDYFRYTRYGLEELCVRAGLEPVVVEPTGGILCFLGHGASSALMTTLGAVPGLRWATWLFNYVLLVRLLDPIDRLIGLPSLYPCDYVLLARKL